MNGPPGREEFDAKISAIAASNDAFLARIDLRFEKMEARMVQFEARVLLALADIQLEMETRFAAMQTEMDKRFTAIHAEMDKRFADLRKTIILTGISSTLAVIFGVGAIHATLLSGMLTAFDSGREVSAVYAQLQRQNEASHAQLRQQMADAEQARQASDARLQRLLEQSENHMARTQALLQRLEARRP